MKTPVALAFSAVFALVSASAIANEPAAAPAKADIAKGEATAVTCQACHTQDGSRGVSAYPILQGQHADYIAKQLADFKSGARKNAIMTGMAAPLSDADVKNVAAFYGAKKPVAGTAQNKDTLALGQKIWRGGIASKQVPACAGCHGPAGAGLPAQYPRLGGQHVEYLELQMNAFRAGERTNSTQMTAIAAKMTDKEIKAVTDYAAGLH